MSTRPKTKAQLEALRLPDLQALLGQLTGAASRCPNRTFLIRKILEAQAASTPAAPAMVPIGTARILDPDEPDPTETTATAGGAAAAVEATATPGQEPGEPAGRRRRAPRGAYRTMTVPELREAYVAIVGRPTESTHRNYLIWKIREAEKGRVPVGPREQRRPRGPKADDAMQILPLRATAAQVKALDTAWRSAGVPSRMQFIRQALRRELKRLGAPEAAALFSSA